MIKNEGKFIIKYEKADESFVNTLDWDKLNSGYFKAKEFFEHDGEISPIRINLVYSPEEFMFYTESKKHEEWIRARAMNNSTIVIFSPSVVEQYTIHKKDDIIETIIHEISHHFYNSSCIKKNLKQLPLWNEGIANSISEKNKNSVIDFEFNTLKDFKNHPYKNYVGGYRLIESIIKKFGDEGNKKILKFLNEISSDETEVNLFKKFEEIFEMDVNTLLELKEVEKK